jgi:hypothetical protein
MIGEEPGAAAAVGSQDHRLGTLSAMGVVSESPAMIKSQDRFVPLASVSFNATTVSKSDERWNVEALENDISSGYGCGFRKSRLSSSLASAVVQEQLNKQHKVNSILSQVVKFQ